MSERFDTLVFCTSYIADRRAWDERYERWLRHHLAIDFGKALICMIDDASPFRPEAERIQLVDVGQPRPPRPERPLMLRFDNRLGRIAVDNYPGWWRSFLYSVPLAEDYGCRKIVHIESDAYILTRRMADFINAIESGWTAFWCRRWNFPETAIQVICEDQFDAMQALLYGGWERYAGKLAECTLPFTNVVKDPQGDRYGEFSQSIPDFADFAMQVTPAHKVWFR